MRRISFTSGGVRNHRKDRRLSMLQLTVTADGQIYDSLDGAWVGYVSMACCRTGALIAAY